MDEGKGKERRGEGKERMWEERRGEERREHMWVLSESPLRVVR